MSVATITLAAATFSNRLMREVSADRHYWVSALSWWHIAPRCYIKFASGGSDGSASPWGTVQRAHRSLRNLFYFNLRRIIHAARIARATIGPQSKTMVRSSSSMRCSYHTARGNSLNFGGGPAKWTCARNGLDSNSESMRSFQYIAAALIVVG